MTLSDILVIMGRSPAADIRLELAIAYAGKHGARVNGIIYGEQGSVPRALLAEMETLFLERTEDAGVDSRWYGCGVQKIHHLAHASDLIVVGQSDSRAGGNAPPDLPERLVLSTGRPVVTVPYTGRFIPRCDRILVAWSDGRESARALHDALPLLLKAEKVHLVNLVTEKAGIDGADARLDEIVGHLCRAGVRVKGEMILSIDFPAGDMLLNRACEERSDLLVLGAYNSSSSGKPVLGQVTRHLLRQMTLPVLMSH